MTTPQLVPFAFSALDDAGKEFVVSEMTSALAEGNERRLYSILTHVTDIDESIKVLARDVKRELKRRHGACDVNAVEDLNGDTCLHYAARAGHPIVLRLMHNCGLLKNLDEYVNREGSTPLHEAVHKKQVMFIRQLMFLGANPKAPNRCGQTPASIARKLGDPLVLAALTDERNRI